MSFSAEPEEVPLLRRAFGFTLAVLLGTILAVAAMRFVDGAMDYLFPEPSDATDPERIVLCGRVGKYRLYCGVGDDFRGPTEDPIRQWK